MTERLTDEEVRMLARAFHLPRSAMAVLERAGLERWKQPSWTAQNALEFWDEVNNQLYLGVLADGRVRILTAAAELFPANRVFAAVAAPARSAAGAGPPAGGAAPTAGPAGADFGGVRAPVGRVLFAIDPVRFGPVGVGVPVVWRDGLRQLLGLAARGCDLPADAVSVQDRGDGLLGAVRDDVPAELVVADLMRELRHTLHTYNSMRGEKGRVRLRVALHQGQVVADEGAGVRGGAAQAASRLVDTPALSRLLGEFPTAEMAVIISATLFATTVDRRLHDLDPGSFRRVETDVPGLAGPAWVQAATPAAGPAGDGRVPAADQRPGPPPVASIITEEPRPAAGWDFLVSAAKEDSGWGEWCAWLLERQGYQAHLDTWDVVAGDHLVGRLDEAVSRSRRTLVILSENYLTSTKVQAEWQAAWSADPTGMKRRLIPVRVAVCRPEGLLRGISYIDLVDLDGDTAQSTFVEGIDRAVQGRYRPSEPPPFPGGRPRP
ncbi:toll/interleukin-1 receptor domain-containing protein [Frankia sp. QA3]|uniref:toll/interleukin-1 receptor domain-containing protein n=1 Tax=Frankia sp. QA3 TaxID=710111 RepID=UPI000269C523|nr:toll/interleukin-1 receptor domain-containing protein [Frankia sp. QA3]EIV94383.1 TIR domain-containing protein [Frankia sp. QA3]